MMGDQVDARLIDPRTGRPVPPPWRRRRHGFFHGEVAAVLVDPASGLVTSRRVFNTITDVGAQNLIDLLWSPGIALKGENAALRITTAIEANSRTIPAPAVNTGNPDFPAADGLADSKGGLWRWVDGSGDAYEVTGVAMGPNPVNAPWFTAPLSIVKPALQHLIITWRLGVTSPGPSPIPAGYDYGAGQEAIARMIVDTAARKLEQQNIHIALLTYDPEGPVGSGGGPLPAPLVTGADHVITPQLARDDAIIDAGVDHSNGSGAAVTWYVALFVLGTPEVLPPAPGTEVPVVWGLSTNPVNVPPGGDVSRTWEGKVDTATL